MQGKFLMTIFMTTMLFGSAGAQELDDIRRLLDNERYAAAEETLEKKIDSGIEDPELNYLMVKTYLEQEKTSEAGQFVEERGLKAPYQGKNTLDRVAYARYLMGTGNYQDAGDIIAGIMSVKRNTKDPVVLYAVADAYIGSEKGNLQEAIAMLVKAGDKDEKDPEIDMLKGNAYRKLGDGSNAYKAYAVALRKDPDNPKANYLMGKIFRAQKNPELYMDYFMKAYRADSTYAPVLDELYDHYYYRDFKQAKKYLEKYIAATDYSVENDYAYTDILYLNKEYDAAIRSATAILEKEKEKAQPRLHKLIAYSYEAAGDTAQAAISLDTYFQKEDPARIIGPDYALKAKLTAGKDGMDSVATELYAKAFALDTLTSNKTDYAVELAKLSERLKDYSAQAKWLKYVYEHKEQRTNLDLFYWGVAHFNAKEYALADSVFVTYTTSYPENVYGYYWRGRINGAIDTSMNGGLAVPHYEKVVELGEKDKAANKAMLAKAYGYLGSYEANTTKDFEKALAWFERFLAIDPGNEDALRYTEILKEWIAKSKEENTVPESKVENDQKENKE